MDANLVSSLIESGGLLGFATVVWWELRALRMALVKRIDRLDEKVTRVEERTRPGAAAVPRASAR